MKSKSLLKEFTKYCQENPDERFWQALRNWSESDRILFERLGKIEDTFFWEFKDELGL